MRKVIRLIFLYALFMGVIYSVTPKYLQAEVTPDYCEEALNRCIQRCGEIFEVPALADACRFGCYIALRNCGRQN
ncbi:MAG: hypothetical protein ACPL25_10280 [Ignavibacteria bacterium]